MGEALGSWGGGGDEVSDVVAAATLGRERKRAISNVVGRFGIVVAVKEPLPSLHAPVVGSQHCQPLEADNSPSSNVATYDTIARIVSACHSQQGTPLRGRNRRV
jgi:hypothetical protein